MSWIESVLPGMAHAPNLHPMLVHFPVVLLPAALLVAAFAWWRRPGWWPAARAIYVVGLASLVIAGAAGFRAQSRIAHGPHSAVSVHRQYMLAAGGLALVLVVPALALRPTTGRRRGAWFLAGLSALNVLVVLGADRGAMVSLALRSGPEPADRAVSLVPPPVSAAAHRSGNAEAGASLYERLACDACHGPDRREEVPGIPPSIETAGSRLRDEWSRAYLLDPRPVRWADQDLRPEARMPDYRFTSDEAGDLVAFLSQRQDASRFDPRGPDAPPYSPQEIENGRRLIGEYNCRGCHALGGTGVNLGPALDAVGERLKPEYVAALLRAPHEVVPGTPMRDFGLWDDEIRNLTAYLMALKPAGVPR